MIIQRIQARNVLKYRNLLLDDLSAEGLIAISGQNESGKSSIGEILCFALFGRTFSLDYDNLEKIIHWGQTHCSVEVDFIANDGNAYRIERFLDDSGSHSARLRNLGVEAEQEPLAKGVEKVADLLYELIGYEFEEFVESFYLAQREITTPHPHSTAVKIMAGLLTLEYCAEGFQDDVEAAHHNIDKSKADITNTESQIEEIDLDEHYLPELKNQYSEYASRMAGYEEQVISLEGASAIYQDALVKQDRVKRSGGSTSFLRFIFLLLALITVGAWGLLTQMPEHEFAVQLSQTLESVPYWQPDQMIWLLYASGAFFVLFLLFWARKASQKSQLKRLAEAGRQLAEQLDALDQASPQSINGDHAEEGLDEEETVEGGSQDAATEMQAEIEIGTGAIDLAARERLSKRATQFLATATEVRDGVEDEIHRLQALISAIKERMGWLNKAISEEQERIERVEQLSSVRNDLQLKLEDAQHQVERGNLAGELIKGAMREVSYQFNNKVRNLVSKTLPLFTEGRYEHLQIADDLSVRVFSSEKRDFMDLEEISSGTQRQIMLAVRLALSQELVARAVKGKQFLFLDEPFAFFDQARTRGSMQVLPTLSDQIKQIWIIGQEFPEGMSFDQHIECHREHQSIP